VAGQLYVGGNFFGIAGGLQNYLALFGSTPLALNKAFDAKLDNQVRAIALTPDNKTLFIAGDFTKAAGQGRLGVAQLDALTGNEPNPWDAQMVAQGIAQIRAVLPIGQAVYVGGLFRGAGGENRSRIGSIHAVFGAASGWDPGADNPISVIAHSQAVIVIGGDFTRLGIQGSSPNLTTGGQPVPYLAAFNALPSFFSINVNSLHHIVLNVGDGDGSGSSLLVQVADALTNPNWTTIQTLDILGLQDPIEDPIPAGKTTRFYRMSIQP
jgi:hypothetical protein